MSYVAGSELAPGTTVAGYRIEALIGRGGMGAVYRAEEEGLGRKVALKVIAPELAQDERFRERFLRESRIAASLDHPHVIPIYHAGAEGGLLFLAMRYVEGTDLAKLLVEEGTLESARALTLLEQVASALDAAHERGLVHRDVKPSNVLIARAAGKEDCYLADFGLTKRRGSISGLTAPEQVVGTLDYIAPEQIKAEGVDARADLYSLACVLYECLTGAPPFERATDVAVLWGHVHEDAPPLGNRRPELPRSLDDVLKRGLAKEPDRRFATGAELIAAARAALLPGALPARRRHARTAVAGLLALALGAAIAVGVLALRSGPGGLSAASPNAVGIIDPETNKLVGQVLVGARPGSIAVGEGAVWVANLDDETLSRIEPKTQRVERTIPVGALPGDIAVRPGAVWVLQSLAGAMRSVGLESNKPGKTIKLPAPGGPRGMGGITIGAGGVWAALDLTSPSGLETALFRIDPAKNRKVLETHLLAKPTDLAFGMDALWVTHGGSVPQGGLSTILPGNVVLRISPRSGETTETITVGSLPSGVAIGEGGVWVSAFEDDEVWRLDVPAGPGEPTRIRETIPVGDGPAALAVGEGGVWVANSRDGTVSRIDPKTDEVAETIDVGETPVGIAVGEGFVWVTVQARLSPTDVPFHLLGYEPLPTS